MSRKLYRRLWIKIVTRTKVIHLQCYCRWLSSSVCRFVTMQRTLEREGYAGIVGKITLYRHRETSMELLEHYYQ